MRNGKLSPVQGPDSKQVKYPPFLCEQCNSTLTRPFDLAYDHFMGWLFAHEADVLADHRIDFRQIYGDDFQRQQLDLLRYFVKSFGCRLTEAGQPVPTDLKNLLFQDDFQTPLRITFAVSEDILALPAHVRLRFIAKGDLTGYADKERPAAFHSYVWDEQVSWFMIDYWYGTEPDEEYGSGCTADAQHVHLGSMSGWTREKRAEILSKLAKREAPPKDGSAAPDGSIGA